MLFNLYGDRLEKVSLSIIEKNLKKFKCTKDEIMTAFLSTQLNAGQTVFNDGKGWTHEVIYCGY